MKHTLKSYLHTARTSLPEVDASRVIDILNRSDLPFRVKQTRSPLQRLKRLALPVAGLVMLGGIVALVGLSRRRAVRAWFDQNHRHRPSDAVEETAQPDAAAPGEGKHEARDDVVQNASEDSFPASDPPSFNLGVRRTADRDV